MARTLLLLLALSLVGTTVAANVSLAGKGPPPRCSIHPLDPRCRPN